MQIKTVSESTLEKKGNISSRDIQLLLGKVSRFENELWLAKNIIQDLLTLQQNKDHNNKKTYELTRTISGKMRRTVFHIASKALVKKNLGSIKQVLRCIAQP